MIAVPDWYAQNWSGTNTLSSYEQSTSATTNGIYQIWVSQQSLATTTITTRVWNTWAIDTYDQMIDLRQWQGQQPRYGELARVEHPPRPHDAHTILRDRVIRERAEERADELLMSLLTPSQLIQYRAAKAFEVCAKSGRRYRLTRAIAGSVKLIGPDGRAAATYCAHLRDTRIPIPDHLIAQKFLIEHHEEEFLRVANRS